VYWDESEALAAFERIDDAVWQGEGWRARWALRDQLIALEVLPTTCSGPHFVHRLDGGFQRRICRVAANVMAPRNSLKSLISKANR
jgi:hypothetical protein